MSRAYLLNKFLAAPAAKGRGVQTPRTLSETECIPRDLMLATAQAVDEVPRTFSEGFGGSDA
jgi:hypothetical protein